MIASKEISEEEYMDFSRRYYLAQTSLFDKEKEIEAVASELECGLELLGSTAIEDKLQEDVSQTISDIRQAGIQLWVLTGDKVETAINIGLSCKLLDEQMDKFILQVAKTAKVMGEIEKIHLKQAKSIELGRTNGLIVTGDCLLRVLLHKNLRENFIRLCEKADVVLACRVSPK